MECLYMLSFQKIYQNNTIIMIYKFYDTPTGKEFSYKDEGSQFC